MSPGSGDVARRPWAGFFTRSRDTRLQPSYARASVKAAAGLGRVTLLPLEFPPAVARIATVRDDHPEAAVFGRRLPPRAIKPPRRPHSSPTRRRYHRAAKDRTPRSVLLGEVTVSCMPRSFAPVMFPDPSYLKSANAWCVHCLFRFVKSPTQGETVTLNPSTGSGQA